MPGRIAHTSITILLAGGSLVPLVWMEVPHQYIASFTGGILITIPVRIRLSGNSYLHVYLNPDMDIRENISGWASALGFDAYREIPHRSGLTKRSWRRLRSRFWRVFFMSHLPFIGTFLRFLILVMLSIIPVVIFKIEGWVTLPILLTIWLGMSLSDTGHALADLIVSWWRRIT